MPKKGRNIYKRKDGRWEGRYIKCRINNKIKYGYVYAGSYTEVKEKLINISLNDSFAKTVNSSKDLSFKAIGKRWIDSLKPQLKTSSIVKYHNILTTYLYPRFGDYSIGKITSNDISDLCMYLLNYGSKKKSGLSPKTVSGILSVLKSVFKYALNYENIATPNFSSIKIKQISKPMRILSLSEQYRLNQYLTNNKSLINIGILVCIYTGIRIGEVCALKWADISLDEKYISINHTMQRLQVLNSKDKKTQVTVSAPKSNCSIRAIPIPNNLYIILNEIVQPDDAFLLTGSKLRYIEPRTLQNHFKKAIKFCNIEDVNFHALRHTFSTRCIELGFDIKSLSEILGHASVNITLNRYVHPSMELKQKNMNMLSDLYAVK